MVHGLKTGQQILDRDSWILELEKKIKKRSYESKPEILWDSNRKKEILKKKLLRAPIH